MKINQLLESEQLDELDWGKLGTGLKQAGSAALHGVAKVAGAIPGTVVGAGKAVAQGYRGARNAVAGGQIATPSAGNSAQQGGGLAQGAKNIVGAFKGAPAADAQAQAAPTQAAPVANTPAAPAQTAPAAETPAQAQQSKVGVGQINKILPTLRARDLTSIKNNLDKVIASKQKAPPAAAPAQTPPGQTVPTATGKTVQLKKGGKPAPAAAPEPTEQDKTVAALKARRAQGLVAGKENKGVPVVEFYSNFLGQKI